MPVATTDAFRRITVQPDNVTIVAEQVGDTLTLVAGLGISLVANPASDQITIVNTNYSSSNTDPIFNSLTVDGIVIDTNVIRGTDSNANLELTTNGTGSVLVSKLRTTEDKIALGQNSNAGVYGIGIGNNAGQTNQGQFGIAIGQVAGLSDQGYGGVAIGVGAGSSSQGSSAVAVGRGAGNGSQGANAIAIGYSAGNSNQPANSIVINASGNTLNGSTSGFYVDPIRNTNGGTFLNYNTTTKEIGYTHDLTVGSVKINTNVIQTIDSNANLELTASGTGAVVVSKLRTTEANIALGSGAGATSQTTGAIAIGQQAGESSQSLAIAIGVGAGQGSQGFMAVALGHGSAVVGQGANGVAIGASAGELNQGSSGIAIGYYAGKTTQESGAVAIGYTTGQVTQRTGAVAIGWSAGQTNQGANAIAIGYRAGFTNQNASSIVLNASGSALEAGAAGLYINPVRPTSTFFKPLMYDTATSEIAYSSVLEFTGSTISTSDSSGITVDVPTTFNSDISVQNDLNVGRVRFPDSTIQTTAWPGSIPTSIVSSNITVNGTNAYTLTSSPAATPLTITVTPNTATSLITVTFQFTWHPSEPEASGSTGMRLFIYKNGVQQASSEYLVFTSGNGDVYNSYPVHYSWPDVSGTTSPVTYTVYANKTGGNGGTIGMALESKFPCWATIVG